MKNTVPMHKLLLIFLLLAGCSTQKQPTQTAKPLILVSIPPYQTLVQQLGGDAFAVQTVAPSNSDPHSFEPTFSQIVPLKKGVVWFQIGECFEKKLVPLLTNTECIDIAAGAGPDRHLWLSPKQLAVQAEIIAKTLSEHYPAEKELIAARLEKVKQSLTVLDNEVQTQLKDLSARTFVVSHPAFGYFCRDYNCRQLSVEHEGKEPRPQEIESLLAEIQTQQPELAVALPQHNNKGAQAIAERLHIPVRVIDPYDAEYAGTIRKLADLLVNPYDPE